ncbi:MAG: SDR family oxidoreductase [Deltaproteobacteria bacterium]|nr:SDR family oxidoreductase [Nannocystaceae bacterium]
MQQRFHDRVVVITGASAGIGAAAARGFAREGAKVVLAARGREALERVVTEIEGTGGTAIAVATDVADPAAIAALLERAAAEFGGIDVLVNNAGANHRGEIRRFEARQLAQVVEVNLTAPIVACRLALPWLERSSAAAIVNVASLAGRVPVVHEATYSATKFGLRAFSIALAEELRAVGIKVSIVSPGPVDTGFIMDSIDEVPDLVFSQPMSTAEQIAELVLDCAHDGKLERMRPRMGGHLATVAYLFPALRRVLVPLFERRGARAKARFKARAGD